MFTPEQRARRNEACKRWQAKNLAYVRAQQRSHYKEVRKHKLAQHRCYYVKNKNRINARKREYYEQNKTRLNLRVVIRRTRIAKNGGTFTFADIQHLKIKQNHRCVYCPRSIRRRYHIDHKTPVIRGGSSHPRNLQLTCPQCNLSKHTKTHSEFLKSRRAK